MTTLSRSYTVNLPAKGDQPARSVRVDIAVDFDAVAKRLAGRAARSKGGRSIECGGAVVCLVKR